MITLCTLSPFGIFHRSLESNVSQIRDMRRSKEILENIGKHKKTQNRPIVSEKNELAYVLKNHLIPCVVYCFFPLILQKSPVFSNVFFFSPMLKKPPETRIGRASCFWRSFMATEQEKHHRHRRRGCCPSLGVKDGREKCENALPCP